MNDGRVLPNPIGDRVPLRPDLEVRVTAWPAERSGFPESVELALYRLGLEGNWHRTNASVRVRVDRLDDLVDALDRVRSSAVSAGIWPAEVARRD